MTRRIRIVTLSAAVLIATTLGLGVYALVGSSSTSDTSLPGFALAKPVLAQSASLPDAQAGLSAYIHVNPASIDFDKIVADVFTDMIFVGDNFILGKTSIGRALFTSCILMPAVEVRVYVENSGLLLAYLTSDLALANMFRWTEWDPAGTTLDTVLQEALEVTVAAIGQTIDPALISWYHWAFPGATSLAAAARKGNGNMFMAVPASPAIVFGLPSYSWHSPRQNNYFSGNLQVNGMSGHLTLAKEGGIPITLESPQTCTQLNVSEVVLDPGALYTFAASDGAGRGLPDNHRLGLAVLYSVP